MSADKSGLLYSLQVLDLSDEKGMLCGKMLADMGARVIKMEVPGGDSARMFGPFYGDIPHPENSLYWLAYNAGKKSITLDFKADAGRHLFVQLLKRSDIFIETFAPGYLATLGYGFDELKMINPRLVEVSITPFGQDGPYRDYNFSDLVGLATGGFLSLCGDPDRPPVRTSFPQACLHAGAQAAVGAVIAYFYRERTGRGQRVDVSVQQSSIGCTLNAVPSWELNGTVLKRAGQFRVGITHGATPRQTWPCKDGYVSFFIGGGIPHSRANRALVKWMSSEGMADDFLNGMDWDTLDMARVTREFFEKVEAPVGRFLMTHTKAKLYEEGVKRHLEIYPVSTFSDISNSLQLKAREYWSRIEQDGAGTAVTFPGAFIKASETPLQVNTKAPKVGEHNREIFIGELGLSETAYEFLQKKKII